jgi:predicted amidophosphoribosyltransferase
MVLPIPLHPRQLRRRGFNPACVLARAVAGAIGAPVAPTGLQRVRDTPSQTGLDRAQRRRNVRGAFAATPRLEVPEDVWLVDDVVTTGATLSAAAQALRNAGVRRIVAVCAARTLAPG